MHRHGTAIATPPPLQPLAAFPPSPQRTLSYRCLSTSAPAAAQQRRQDECSVVEFALCGDDEQHGTYSLSGASADNISPADVHAFFAHPLHEDAAKNSSSALTAHHPVFLHRSSRCTCRLFDVLLGGKEQQRQSNDTLSSHVVQRLHEAVSLAVTAHTETLPSTFNAHPHVAAIAEKLYCVFLRLLPRSVWPLVSLGLTLTSEEVHLLGEAGDTCSAETHSGCLRLHWSWVAGPFARPALQQGSLFRAPLCDSSACEHLWQHWVAGVTQTQRRNAAAREEDARYGDVSAAHQRLQHNAERARHFFLLPDGDVHESPTPTEDEKKAVQLCAALLAVLVEAKALEAYWASSHTPLCLHSPLVLVRYFVVWFTFLGGALQRNVAAAHVEAAVRAALLHERLEEKASLPVLLRVVCRWATTVLLSSVLQSMPSRLHLSVQPSVLRKQRETHLLFRGGEGSSGANPFYHDPMTSTQCNDQNKRQQLASPQERALTRLLDKLYSCAMGCEQLSNTRTAPSCFSGAVVLTHSLFTHPAQHGVTVCRLHLYTPPQHGVVPLSASSPAALVGRRVVAALLTWYAVDFEVVFWQSYCCWALARRYGAPKAVKDREAASCGGVRVDAAIVCHGARSQSISSLHSTACGGSAPPLGLLGRCLLLALWMQLQLVDVDRREDTEALQVHRAFTTCGTLFYSSRRCVLFARDWRTARHLHSILAGTSCDIASVCNEGASLPPLVETAAANVALAFLRARRSLLRVQERHHGAVAMALRESVLREQAKQHKQARTLRAVGVVQAWMRAKLSCRDVRQLHNDAVALAVEESEEEESCVLLHWSAVEDASLSSLESIRTPPALKREAAAASDAVQWPLTPSRNLANASSFEVSVEDCLTLDSGTTPLSCDSPESLHEAFPTVTPPLTLGQRHLVELEAHARALLIRVQLSEMLWFTVLIECVGRRACEEGEARAWRRLEHLAERSWKVCAAAAVRRRSAETLSGGSRDGGQSLHEDEAAPVTTLLPASLSPLSNMTIDAAEKQLQQRAFNALCCNENAAREALHEAEASERVGLSDVHQQRHAQCLLVAEEALQRSLIVSMWSLAREEWQARWSVLIVPECVLRNLYAETFAQERPRGTATTTKNNTITQHEPTCVPQKKHIGHTPQRLRRPAVQPTSLADVAKAHRAFLLQEEGEDGVPAPMPPVLLPRPTAPVSSTPQRRRLTRAPSSPAAAASTARTTAAAAALAPSSLSSSGAHRRVPVIAVSLCDGEEESKVTVPLQVRPVNQPFSPKKTSAATSLVDAMKAARRRAGGKVSDDSADAGDAASCGWWYVPVTPCSRKNSSARRGTGDVKNERSPLQPREGPRPLFRTVGFPHSVEQRTAVTFKKPTAPDEDAASVVAAAIALARDSGQPAVGARSNPHGAEPRRSVLKSRQAPSVAPPSLTRPPRKRYVTWADDVEEH